MIRKSKFIKPKDIRRFMRIENSQLFLTPGFLALLDMHMEAILKRAAVKRSGQLDAPAALMACRYPFHILSTRMDYKP